MAKKWELDKFYEVEWKDIIAYSGWLDSGDESQPLALCRSHGYLSDYRPGKSGYIRLSGTLGITDGTSEYTQHIVIPLSVITEVKRVASSNEQKKTPGE